MVGGRLMTSITASMLYDLVACPHRVSMDLYANPADRDQVSPFVQLLWERGFAHEQAVIAALDVPFLDLSRASDLEKEKLTLEAMARGVPLIYSGRISANGLLGIPDLLRKEEGGYIAGDIKSGSADEGGSDEEDGKPKVHYAVQVALYTDILEHLGLSPGRRAFIWDVRGAEVPYDFNSPYGVRNPRTLWHDYQECLTEARAIVAGAEKTAPAYSSTCKNCVWYTACLKTLEETDDLTLIPFLGRSLRDTMVDSIATMKALAEINPDGFITDKGKKTVFPGLGPDRLRKMQARAKLIVTKDSKPYLSGPVTLPLATRELFFDIEVDPMRDVCYLHGFVERSGGDNATETFTAFFADNPTPEEEERAFAGAWAFMKACQPCMVYYYSKYERTLYRKLRARYPSVCSVQDIETLFDPTRAVDLYFDVVLKATEWPTRDYSIKTLAKHLGFNWRDTHPSGAASIEWFHRWVETQDGAIKQRILDYNEDDCRATRILLDGIRAMAA
jgi:uncharacterized protein